MRSIKEDVQEMLEDALEMVREEIDEEFACLPESYRDALVDAFDDIGKAVESIAEILDEAVEEGHMEEPDLNL